MANRTNARGSLTITLEKTSGKEFIDFISALRSVFESFEYPTVLGDINVTDEHTAECSFSGDGRWAYSENIKSFGYWCSFANKRDTDAAKALTKYDFKLAFSFVDYDPGLNILYTEKASTEHKKNEPMNKSRYEFEYRSNIEANADNLISYGVFEEGEVIDRSYDNDKIREFLEDEGLTDEQVDNIIEKNKVLYKWMKDLYVKDI